MAHTPQAPQGPEGAPDPAGSTQMFRAFVAEGSQTQRPGGADSGGGLRFGLILGVVLALVVVGAAVWLALG